VTFGGAQLKRGERFSVQGTARNAKGEACSLMRIDVVLFDSGSRSTFSAGTLVTDQQGKYAGQLVLPQRVPVGDYQVRASSPGHQTCAASD
jgi:protocatechuate 3,4-dioxygenase beta subunit